MERSGRRRRNTLDGQLVGYWAREAARLDALAAEARFGWLRRHYERRAAQARAQGERSRAREAARGNLPEAPGLGADPGAGTPARMADGQPGVMGAPGGDGSP